jgi:hypothetical protein
VKKLLTVLAAAAAVSLVAAVPVSASHSWANYHWGRTANPFGLKVGDNVTASWDAYLNTADTDWTRSAEMELVPVAGTSNKRCSMTAGTVQVCNSKYGNNGWLGLASINVSSSGHITQGSAKMNDTYFASATYNNPNEKLHVMCQEVGHTFGLGHTSEDGSSQDTCMDYFSNTGANATSTLSTHPNQHDYDQLSAIYGHADATTTLASAPATSGQAAQPGARPYRIRRHDHGRHTVIVEEFSDGSKRIVDVIWTASPRPVVQEG